jgi:hypothetical protein
MTLLQKAATREIAYYGGVRAAARELGICYSYLSRIRTGKKLHPSEAVLEKLGLTRTEVYKTVK